MKRYPEYKDSHIAWLGEIPSHWEINKIGALFTERKTKVSDKEYSPLSVARVGIVPQLDTAVKTDAGDNRKLVCVGDFVINSRSDRKGSSGLSEYNGSVSLINIVLIPRKKILGRYAHHLLRSRPFTEEFYRNGHGIVSDLWTTRFSEMKSIYIPLPPLSEQDKIARYLDYKVSRINKLISLRKKQLIDLAELKKVIINNSVTKGLNPNAELKQSGVDILGEIPAHWDLRRLKFLCEIFTGNHNTEDSIPDGKYPLYVRSPIIEKANTYTYDGEGILIAGDGAGAGRIFHHAFGKYAIHQRVYCLHNFNNVILPRFLYHFISSRFTEEMEKGSRKATVPSIRLPMLKNFRICIPPPPYQNKIKSLHISTIFAAKSTGL